jgi:hypothetical protein
VITEVPAVTPDTIPEPEPTVATEVELLLQVPPDTASLNVVVDPVQTVSVPVIAAGNGVTVTMVVTALVPIAYEIVVVPADTAVTVPLATVATLVALLLHTPPEVTLLSVVVPPEHNVVVPVIKPIPVNPPFELIRLVPLAPVPPDMFILTSNPVVLSAPVGRLILKEAQVPGL